MASSKEMQDRARAKREQEKTEAYREAVYKKQAEEILTLIDNSATLLLQHGVKLTDEGIFKTEDRKAYMLIAQSLSGMRYNSLLIAMAAHDDILLKKYGVDLSAFTGKSDLTTEAGYKVYADAKSKLDSKDQMMVALFDAINGFLIMHNMV